ncbi:MAG: hypothetical protein LIO91_03760 [Bacteroidales bacterium]|nr:hypothetical protein [Bacteroidales bacterium]
MEKTEKAIERDLFRLIRDSSLGVAIQGSLYRGGQRPKNATTEDIVVKFLAGVDGQEQSGVINVNVYVPDIKSVANDGEVVENITRVDELEEIANAVCSNLDSIEYWYTKDGTPKTYACEDIDQHFINIRINYRRKTF